VIALPPRSPTLAPALAELDVVLDEFILVCVCVLRIIEGNFAAVRGDRGVAAKVGLSRDGLVSYSSPL
jgi:hypothetical protein